MSTLIHPHVTCIWSDIPIELGTSVVAFKPMVEACQTGGECINHLHHIHHSVITISTSWLLNSPIPFVISWFSWPLITCIFQCSKLMTIWSSVSLKSTMTAEMFCSWTSLWFSKWLPFAFRPDHWLVTKLIQHLLVSHISILHLYFLWSSGSYYRFFGFHKFYFLGNFDNWTTFSSISQTDSVGERFLLRKNFIKVLGGDSLYFSICLNHFKLKKFNLCVSFSQLSIQRLYFTFGLLMSH